MCFRKALPVFICCPQVCLCAGCLLGAPPFPFRNPTYQASTGKVRVTCIDGCHRVFFKLPKKMFKSCAQGEKAYSDEISYFTPTFKLCYMFFFYLLLDVIRLLWSVWSHGLLDFTWSWATLAYWPSSASSWHSWDASCRMCSTRQSSSPSACSFSGPCGYLSSQLTSALLGSSRWLWKYLPYWPPVLGCYCVFLFQNATLFYCGLKEILREA